MIHLGCRENQTIGGLPYRGNKFLVYGTNILGVGQPAGANSSATFLRSYGTSTEQLFSSIR